MLAVTLTIGTLVSIMFFFVGGVVGWLARENTWVNQPIYTHPEMFDENGNVLPDEILAVRFENGYDELRIHFNMRFLNLLVSKDQKQRKLRSCKSMLMML